MASTTGFIDYPEPIEGPDDAYKPKEENNPVLRGVPLVLFSRLIAAVPLVRQLFWRNAGFGDIKDMPCLDGVPYRFHPTVIPISNDKETMLPINDDLMQRKFTSSPTRYYTVRDYNDMYKSGKVTPLQVVDALLPLIKQGQSPQGLYENAWVDSHGMEHLVLKAAKASTERWASGRPLSVLDGVPIGVKDDIEIEGYISHIGLKYDPSVAWFKPQEKTVWPVRKLLEAGAIVIGKNRMHEIGSDTSGCNVHQGTPTNHMNQSYYPGGSSSGGSSALGAGVVPICIGTDAGGSTRVPPTYNGVYGFKTTHHRTMFMNNTMCIVAPMAASVSDLTIAYRVMSQPNPECATSGKFAISRPPPSTQKRVMGVYRDWWKKADPRVVERCEKALDYFAKEKGYEIVDITIPHVAEAQAAHGMICIAELAESHRRRTENPKDWLSICGAANKVVLSVGSSTPTADYLRANALREVIMRHLAFLFQKYPGLLIITPALPVIGWPRNPADDAWGMSDTNLTLASMLYVFLANLTGTPALTAPVGYVDPEQGEGRLAISLMATGEWGSEEQLLEWAGEAEEYLNERVEGGRRRPETWLDVLELVKSSQ